MNNKALITVVKRNTKDGKMGLHRYSKFTGHLTKLKRLTIL